MHDIEQHGVEQAQQQLIALLDEVARLAEQEIDATRFFTLFTERAATTLGALAAGVWLADGRGAARLVAQFERPGADVAALFSTAENERLIQQQLAAPHPQMIGPGGGLPGTTLKNNTHHLLMLVPIRVQERVAGVLEIYQRFHPDAQTQAGYLACARRFCEFAAVFLLAARVRALEAKLALWNQWADLHQSIHGSLRSQKVSAAIANEGRLLLDCDRVSVAIQRRGKLRIAAVSGKQSIDHRSPVMEHLTELATAVISQKEAYWYTGFSEHTPPQIEAPLNEYLDESHAKIVGVLPLALPGKQESDEERSLIGALLVECLSSRPIEQLQETARMAQSEAELALANALRHEGLFLFPLWNKITQSKLLVSAKNWPRTKLVAACVGLAILALTVIPWRFEIHANGTLQPKRRHDVFATADGTVDRVLVKHGQQVEQGQLLAALRNTDLEVAITDLNGQQAATLAQLAAVERTLSSEGKRLESEQRMRLSGQRNELLEQLDSQRSQLTLLEQKREQLSIVSPLAGKVVTWDVHELLDQRPVHRGQILLTVADTTGDWELELQVPENRLGHLTEAQRRQGEALPVVYRLATDPGHDHAGTIQEVELAAEIHGDAGNTVQVRVKIDRAALDNLRPGADCRAKIRCGEHSLGYVLLYDAWVFFDSRVLFRF
ncbi:MAG: efflux RND transporter periplasmic adaptor subunit [Planctomycetes bacterium]|nr:efflux RND transporter periplasmic adaptor subunit [Planctomycetota bacterium]